jgi:hypothetical protein
MPGPIADTSPIARPTRCGCSKMPTAAGELTAIAAHCQGRKPIRSRTQSPVLNRLMKSRTSNMTPEPTDWCGEAPHPDSQRLENSVWRFNCAIDQPPAGTAGGNREGLHVAPGLQMPQALHIAHYPNPRLRTIPHIRIGPDTTGFGLSLFLRTSNATEAKAQCVRKWCVGGWYDRASDAVRRLAG